jgi:hypothetical protein
MCPSPSGTWSPEGKSAPVDGLLVFHASPLNFEVIVGKSVPEDRADRYFGFVQTFDAKPRRRLFEVLRGQGFQMNQDITFLTDGGDDVRDLAVAWTGSTSPCG